MKEDIFAWKPALSLHIQVQDIFMLLYPLAAVFDVTFREVWSDVPAKDTPIFYVPEAVVALTTEQASYHARCMAVIDMQCVVDCVALIIDCYQLVLADSAVAVVLSQDVPRERL